MGTGNRPHLLRHRVLGGDAFYRVVDAGDSFVVVEVVSAPGLDPGARLRFTQAAIAQMSLVEEAEWERSMAGHADSEGDTLPQPDHESTAAS